MIHDDFRLDSRHLTSKASPSDREREIYLGGACHAFAVALHRRYGFRLLAVCDPDQPFWEDEDDADNSIPSVLHVFALDENGNAWDVLGSRPRDEVIDEMKDRYRNLDNPYEDEMSSEVELMEAYADMDGNCFRPLSSIGECDVEEADGVAARVFEGMIPEQGAPIVPN